MPPRNPVPLAIQNRHPSLIRHCTAEYETEVERERLLPKDQRLVSNIGFSYFAIGWLVRRDNQYRKRSL